MYTNGLPNFNGERPFPGLAGKTTNPIDDGLASGFTMLAAIKSIRINHPVRIIIAAPTASASSAELTGGEVDHLFCLNIRSHQRFAVAEAYVNWYDREIGKYSHNL
jgi:predicted phosphoribosyltransferase